MCREGSTPSDSSSRTIQALAGLITELMERLTKEGYVYTATEKAYPGFAGNPLSHYDWNLKPGSPLSRSTFNPEGGGCVMSAMLQEAGVKALYNTTFLDVIMKKPPKGAAAIKAVVVKSVAGKYSGNRTNTCLSRRLQESRLQPKS